MKLLIVILTLNIGISFAQEVEFVKKSNSEFTSVPDSDGMGELLTVAVDAIIGICISKIVLNEDSEIASNSAVTLTLSGIGTTAGIEFIKSNSEAKSEEEAIILKAKLQKINKIAQGHLQSEQTVPTDAFYIEEVAKLECPGCDINQRVFLFSKLVEFAQKNRHASRIENLEEQLAFLGVYQTQSNKELAIKMWATNYYISEYFLSKNKE